MSNVVHSDPEIMSGMVVFRGTRVPVKTLFDYLEHGHPLEEFLDHFPTVYREQAIGALEEARELLMAPFDATVAIGGETTVAPFSEWQKNGSSDQLKKMAKEF